ITDVLAFHYVVPSRAADSHVGEIVVNVELAATRAPTRGCRFRNSCRELALYLAHGCDHLCGSDDSTPQARMRMLRREWRWLREAEHLGLLSGLLAQRAMDGKQKEKAETRRHSLRERD
ncbi:MAG: rRNA maturation RNAse YbeY, partial [Kiritimatiellia bacterium]